ncbi:uncharacterized protein NMK_0123 [Novimethylophilus kurashikiensis]|uniref:Uncharacterized protein n=2 Tax=Novimethylophilus kurashikiensis TaxID=1825523 RepID=A0A2R5F1M6_9PROT|nr:uncharacterized protein NMK_0123 [Novimethylophilus kurashikiensis]
MQQYAACDCAKLAKSPLFASIEMTQNTAFMKAVEAAQVGRWDEAHEIVQNSGHPVARWIHAVLHKIEGDAWNSRYWYDKTERRYEDYADPQQELTAIAAYLRENNTAG